jgi:hypothetical protein
VTFTVTDVFGNTVVGSLSAWDHVQKRHPEMVGREDQAKVAIERPVSVHEGNTPNTKVFKGDVLTTGFWANNFPVAIVEYVKNNTGYLRTAYLANRDPRGARIWP